MSEPAKQEVGEGPFLAAEITLGLEPQQDIRTILEPEQADYTDRGIFLGCFAAHREDSSWMPKKRCAAKSRRRTRCY
jgi:hypothetical protein